MIFASDNWAGAHPRISAALGSQAGGFAPAYGASDLDRAAEKRFCDVFEREVTVFFVGTGTAANALALASVAKPGGVAFCHGEAHMAADECGAPEFLSSGGRLRGVRGAEGRMEPANLERAIGQFVPADVHFGRATAVSITQATEVGTVYSLDAIDAIAAIAHGHGLPFHMDGARFANALVSLSCTPAEMTWKRGVDMLSFGGTKNGCWCAEAVVFFEPGQAAEFAFLRKRAAQLFSKSRFIAAQFLAYFEDGLWLETAEHANRMGARLAQAMRGSNTVRLAWEPEANEVFAVMDRAKAEALRAQGAVFYDWHTPEDWHTPGTWDAGKTGASKAGAGESEVLCRFVTSFATAEADVDRFAELLRD